MGAMFDRMLAARPEAVSVLRRAFRRWLAGLGWPAEQAQDMVLALSEAAVNVVEHAYQDAGRRGAMWVRAEHSISGGSRRVMLEVADSGRWRPVQADLRHRSRRRHGLLMMRACTHAVRIDPSPIGTRVHMISQPIDLSAPPVHIENFELDMGREWGLAQQA
jgi:serine/threonine-protein kinase RsbW